MSVFRLGELDSMFPHSSAGGLSGEPGTFGFFNGYLGGPGSDWRSGSGFGLCTILTELCESTDASFSGAKYPSIAANAQTPNATANTLRETFLDRTIGARASQMQWI